MRHLLKWITLVAAAFAVNGCSSFLHGAHEKIEITTSPAGAYCKMYRDSAGFMKSVVTPGSKYIQRSGEPVTVVCEKDGYETASLVISSEKRKEMVGNVTTLGVGAVVDAVGGGLYELPDKVEVIMKKAQ
ncbi:MAG: hypothetical protein R1F54_08550 [Candidatus Zeuxoniibacter abyssi]|nr:MAG: hypothetical protein R1F54_08550 [Candidatus Persebacteraceae bacterium AB1(2)]